MKNRFCVLFICILLLVPVSALAASDVSVRKEPVDLALVVSSFITFCLNLVREVKENKQTNDFGDKSVELVLDDVRKSVRENSRGGR